MKHWFSHHCLFARFAVYALVFCVPLTLHGQTVSFGVAGGASLTGDFRATQESSTLDGTMYTTSVHSDAGRFIFGPAIELGIRNGWSVEANALHRSLEFTEVTNLPGQSEKFQESISSWEFPILLKYRFRAPGVRPFVTVGPSFRTYNNPGGAKPSHYGITTGAGVEFGWNYLRLSPTIRYTHWGADGLPFRPTNRNQVEALVGVQYDATPSAGRALPNGFWFGAIAGVPLTNDFTPLPPGTPGYTGDATRSVDFRFAAGLLAEVEVAGRWSIEANGMYRRLHFENSPEVVVTWEIPVFAKYRFSQERFAPFVEAGPSFRTTGNRNNLDPSHYGFAAGAGIEARLPKFKLTPTLRYTRWGKDNYTAVMMPESTKRDQVEFLVGISF